MISKNICEFVVLIIAASFHKHLEGEFIYICIFKREKKNYLKYIKLSFLMIFKLGLRNLYLT